MNVHTVALSLVFGCVTGFVLGLMGGGGSIITVPVLVFVIGLRVHSATATSLVAVGASALLGTIAHIRRKDVEIKEGVSFGALSMIATVPGVWVNRLVSGKIILLLFAAMMLAVAALMIARTGGGEGGNRTHGPRRKAGKAGYWMRIAAAASVVGFMTGFFGVGGGFLVVPALMLTGRFTAHRAVGTSLPVITLASLSGIVTHLSLGDMNLGIAGLFAGGSAAGVVLGTELGGRIDDRRMSRIFGVFITAVALYVLYKSLFS
jgi:uncharacterized membrane protein YfcA